jgi:hypothetical protein
VCSSFSVAILIPHKPLDAISIWTLMWNIKETIGDEIIAAWGHWNDLFTSPRHDEHPTDGPCGNTTIAALVSSSRHVEWNISNIKSFKYQS